ncbi:DNA polymerase I [Chitinispirillum alkaliphilum]|nr:DNA polymerase I [Chitinispirillum alkaliphilum]
MSEKCLYLIDGHALIYRAYYALIRNPLTNSRGQPTGALFGFANYLLRLIETYTCPYMAVVMDSSKPTFRHEAYELYKANRSEMPDDLKTQMPMILELIEAFNLPVVKQDGLEADDLIAVLTNKATALGFEVFLVTKDKDLMQLVGPDVKMLAPEGTGIFQVFGPQEVENKLGVKPHQIVDYLALIGDSSDNIPGVPGIGPKNAVKILEKAGSVEKLLESPDILESPRLTGKIEEHRERLTISKMLATLKTDIEAGFELEQLKRKDVNREKCIALFKELEFTSLIKNPVFGGAAKLKPTVTVVSSVEQLKKIKSEIRKKAFVSIDTQTTSLLPRAAQLAGISLAVEEENGIYIPLGHKSGSNLDIQSVLDELRDIIEDREILKIGQNLKYEMQVFRNYGIHMRGAGFDTMIAAYLIDPGKRQYDLDLLVPEWLELEVTPFVSIVGKDKSRTVADVEIDKVAQYAAEIVCLPLLLREKLKPLLIERNCLGLFEDIELPLIQVLADVEWQGIKIDTELLSSLSKQFSEEIETISGEIFSLAGEEFNLNSPKQIADLFFGKMGLPGGKKTKSGAFSTNVEVLEKLSERYSIVQKLLDYREKKKLLSTYIDSLPAQIYPQSSRVHTSFNQAVTATGRLSSTNPNLQNIPIRTENGRKIRDAFVAEQGKLLVAADYSQIELRILAHLSDDTFLVEAFKNDQDIHTQTAAAIYSVHPELVTSQMRRVAKTINFGLMYGMGPVNLSKQLKISFGEARKFIETYFHQFPAIRNYMDTAIENARLTGYTETLLGRRRYLPEISASNRNVREAAERTAINTPVQGTAADIIKIAMIRIAENICQWPGAHMLLQVHDELIFEIPENRAREFALWISEVMANAFTLKVPLKVDTGTGKHWGDAH